jgi:hypothetical protein
MENINQFPKVIDGINWETRTFNNHPEEDQETDEEFFKIEGKSQGFSFGGFLGRPLGGTSFIWSTTAGSYKAAYETGLIPFIKSLCFVAVSEIPIISAISFIVSPFIVLLSQKKIKKSS